ncbi:hypothetical protein SAY86_000204 [Trapa natans]|uniref:Uncharacterized protein n=1 Tax=Trapa natans TaxID=22666 RepID=A0AAN7MEN0_TRANT|nr:hypothetical protein SAY86_000204 [Trapa natans]
MKVDARHVMLPAAVALADGTRAMGGPYRATVLSRRRKRNLTIQIPAMVCSSSCCRLAICCLLLNLQKKQVGDAARTGAMAKSFKTGRPLPKRGQIKSRIAANAFHSIVSAISRASSSSSRHRHPSSRRAFSRD